MRIHISGAPGSGKSTFGLWLKSHKLSIVDIDRVYHSYIRHMERDESVTTASFKRNIAKDLQSLFDTISKKPVTIFIGLNYPDPRIIFRGKEIFVKPFKINLDADAKLYIDIDPELCAKQKLKRDGMSDIKEIIKETKGWRSEFVRNHYTLVLPNKLKSTFKSVFKELVKSK